MNLSTSGPSPLYPFQGEAVAEVRRAYRGGSRAPLIVAPTGSGKTRMGTHFVLAYTARDQKALWLAHRDELVGQAVRRLVADGLPLEQVGLVQAEKTCRPSAPVQVASIQTLVARARAGGDLPPAELVVFDEAHHYVSSEWGVVARRYSTALRVGLTATPVRADGSPLGDLFDSLICAASVRSLIDEKYLAPFDLDGPDKYLDGLAEDPGSVLQRLPHGIPTVVFLPTVEMARELAQGLPRAACVDGETPWRERRHALAAFESGAIDTLTNCNVLTEGWDSSRVRRIVSARGCTAWAAWRQIVGRGLRIDRADPGKRCSIIDLRGAVHRHGMPDEDVTFTLDGAGFKRPDKAQQIPLRQCPACWWIGAPPSDRTCPRCERKLPPPPRPRLTPAELERIRSVATAEDRQRYFDKLVREAQERGYAAGWVGFRFKARFGFWPDGMRRAA